MATTRAICPRCQRPITWSDKRRAWWHNHTAEAFRAAGEQPCHYQPEAPIHDFMVTSSDGEVTTYGTKAEAHQLWQDCIHRCIHEPTHAATLTEGDTITGFYARVDGIVLYDSRLGA
jgi:hypothetical protein